MSLTPTSPPTPDDNPFDDMGMTRFWMISTLFYLTFPVSLLFSLVVYGERHTKQLVRALLHDFLQTILVAVVVLALLIWMAIHYLSPFFSGVIGG